MMTHANKKKSHPLSELVAFPFKGQNIFTYSQFDLKKGLMYSADVSVCDQTIERIVTFTDL